MKRFVIPARAALLGTVAMVLWTLSRAAPAMSLMQAYEAALHHDSVYQSARFENQAGQENKAIGRSGLLPSVQYVLVTSKTKADITAPNPLGVPVTAHPEYTGRSSSLTLRQPLVNLEAVARYRQGLAQAHYSEAQFAGRAQELMIRVVSAYANCKFGEDLVALFAAQRDALEERQRLNARMFSKGEGTRTDMLETQARLELAETQLIEASDSLEAARITLASITGQAVNRLDDLVPDFQARPLPLGEIRSWESLALVNNAEVAAARFSVEAAEQEIKKSQAGHAPRLDLNASYGRNKADSVTNYQQASNAGSVGVQLVVPLYAGGYVSAITRQAVANRDKARADLQTATHRVMDELRKQFSTARSSAAKVQALGKLVNSASLLVVATQESAKGGIRINLDVLGAQQQLLGARRDLTQAHYNHLISYMKLRAAAGTLSVDELRTVAAYFR